jgi:eukaryotic-like serine/threonine-protein kinase
MTQPSLIGATLGRFAILREIGRGGMAVVYEARQTNLDRIVALKILSPELTGDANYIARFHQEARSAARLEHPHIVPLYEEGEADGYHYIAMKYIRGGTLKALIEREGPLPLPRAATILAQIGVALDYAHRQGMIHRDVKPSNILLSEEGWAYLSDFGLARSAGGAPGLTIAGTVMGTPEYMSPEQAQGLDSVGPPTDIYALGVVLYEVLTGAFPFSGDTPMAMLAARIVHAPTPIGDLRGDLPPAVEDVVMRALARRPEARFSGAGVMVDALRSAAGIGGPPNAVLPTSLPAGTPAIGPTIRVAPPPPTALSVPPAMPASVAQPAPPRRRSGWRVFLWIVVGVILGIILTCGGLIALGLAVSSEIEDESRRLRADQAATLVFDHQPPTVAHHPPTAVRRPRTAVHRPPSVIHRPSTVVRELAFASRNRRNYDNT